MRGLVIVPSRGRPQSMRRSIAAWNDTNAFEYADLLFCVDDDDPCLPEYNEVASDVDMGGGFYYSIGTRRSMVQTTNVYAFSNAHYMRSAGRKTRKYTAIGSQGDDHVPRTKNWAQRYVETLADMGTGIVYGDDRLQGRNLCTEWMMTSNIIRAIGAMIPAPVHHLYADNSVMALGRQAGILKWLPDVVIEHMHFVNGKSTKDEGYERVNSRERWREDGEAYNRWLRNDIERDVAKVRALL